MSIEEEHIDTLLDNLSTPQLEALRDVLSRAGTLAAGTAKGDTPMTDAQPTEDHMADEKNHLEHLMNQIDELPPNTREITIQEALHYASTLKQVSWPQYMLELDALYYQHNTVLPKERNNDRDYRITWLRLFLEAQPALAQMHILYTLVQSVADTQGRTWMEVRDTIGNKGSLTNELSTALSTSIMNILGGIEIEHTMWILRDVLEHMAERKGWAKGDFLQHLTKGMGIEKQYQPSWLQAIIMSAPQDKQLSLLVGLVQLVLEDAPFETCITTFQSLIDTIADAYGTSRRVILDHIDGRTLSTTEQDVKSAVITDVLRDVSIDDAVDTLRKALTAIAVRNLTTVPTLLGMIGSGL